MCIHQLSHVMCIQTRSSELGLISGIHYNALIHYSIIKLDAYSNAMKLYTMLTMRLSGLSRIVVCLLSTTICDGYTPDQNDRHAEPRVSSAELMVA